MEMMVLDWYSKEMVGAIGEMHDYLLNYLI
jgi:hypothetical protein